MKKKKKSSGLSEIISAVIMIAILSPILQIAGGIISVLIIVALLVIVCYIIYMVIIYSKKKKEEKIITDNSESENILFYQKFISENSNSPVSSKDEIKRKQEQQFISFDIENTVESFDKNYFLADETVNSINDLKRQEDFWNKFFSSILNENMFSHDVRDRIASAKEYTDIVQGIKRSLGIYSSQKCGYSESTYYVFMQNTKTCSEFSPGNGIEFEEYCASLLSQNGFEQVKMTKSSGDQGIDIIGYSKDVKYGIQCKFYSKPVGNRAVQEAFAGKQFYKCHVAVVLTNNTFTKSAIELADCLGIVLWDGNALKRLEDKQRSLYE